MEDGFVKVCCEDDIWDGEIVGHKIKGYEIILVKIDGEVRAYYGLCPHTLGRMKEGFINNDGQIVCPDHEWIFDAKTGESVNPKGTKLPSFEVRIKDGDVYVKVPDLPVREWLSQNLRYMERR